MANIEQALVAEVNGLLVEHLGRNHPERDEIPCLPKALPFLASWWPVGVGWLAWRREAEWRPLKDEDAARCKRYIVDEVQLCSSDRV